MSTHNTGFCEDLTKIIFQLSSNTHLVSSSDNANCKLSEYKVIVINLSENENSNASNSASCLTLFNLFVSLMLYIHGKQLKSRWDGQLLNHTVPGQASHRQFTSIKCPFFRQ